MRFCCVDKGMQTFLKNKSSTLTHARRHARRRTRTRADEGGRTQAGLMGVGGSGSVWSIYSAPPPPAHQKIRKNILINKQSMV